MTMPFGSLLVAALTAGVLGGMAVAGFFLYRRSRATRRIEFFSLAEAKEIWGSTGPMFFFLGAWLTALGIISYGYFTSQYKNIAAQWPELNMMVFPGLLAACAVVSAVMPFCLPRLAIVLRGAAIGVLFGLLVACVNSLIDGSRQLSTDLFFGMAWVYMVVSLASAAVASLAGGALSFVARLLVAKRVQGIALGVAVAAIVLVLVVVPETDWYKTDASYRLVPSTWKGDITMDRAYPFTLVIEEVRPDGQFTGRMDWEGGFRLKIEGGASANHLLFVDTQVLQGSGHMDLNDRKDVWIRDREMSGTDKNGRVKLSATFVALQPAPQVSQAPAAAAPPPSGQPVEIVAQPPSALAPEQEDAGPRAPGAETVSRARSERLCEALGGAKPDRQDGCWMVLALQLRDRSLCGSINGHGMRDDCYAAFGVNEGERSLCEYLSSPERVMACMQAVGADCAISGGEPEAGEGCAAARKLRARAKSDWAAAGNFSFDGFRKTEAAPQSWADCGALDAPDRSDWCRLERVRRNDPESRCEAVTGDGLQDLCGAMAGPRLKISSEPVASRPYIPLR